eukprot:TRINITY_DN3850_c0_g1_i2.p1 TRINITY_DN3850_c0_g1~~TRINITY_DN3850_c0_g1_i2.p1  ORF type:complete len:262 (-),score=12.05 TRINITY_DN3850_c0_g1_i2:232-1017(-)
MSSIPVPGRRYQQSGINEASLRVDFLGPSPSITKASESSEGDDIREEDIWGEEQGAVSSDSESDSEADTTPRENGLSTTSEQPSISRPSFLPPQNVLQPGGFQGLVAGDILARNPTPHGISGLQNALSNSAVQSSSVAQRPGTSNESSLAVGRPFITPSRMIPQPAPNNVLSDHRPARRASAPVNVPDWSKIVGLKKPKAEDGEAEEEEDGEQMVPPHLLMAREYSKSVTFSVFEGVGRTLRGRDLDQVRTSILRKTGFFD